jgi:phage tail-like protein
MMSRKTFLRDEGKVGNMAGTLRKDPMMSFNYLIEIEGLVVGGFSEVSGLQVETKTFQYREGGTNSFVYKFPEYTEYQNIVMKRGISDSDTLWLWHMDVVNGYFCRKNGSIILNDNSGNEKWRWNFFGAYPVKWTGPELKADSGSVAFESIELVHLGLHKGM